MLSHPHVHFCANVIVQRVVVQIGEYSTHTKVTLFPSFLFMCNVCECVECKARASNIIPEKRVLVYVLPDKGEGKQIAALLNQ